MDRTPAPPLVTANARDIDYVYRSLCAAVDEAIGDEASFAAFEKARFNPAYLNALARANGGYVLVVLAPSGERAGFIVSSPEQGNLVLNWSYLEPRFRKGSLAMRALSQYARYWDNDQFDKLIFFARTDKKASFAIGKYAGFTAVAELKRQFFGQDFVLFEKHLTKTEPGFALAPAVGFMGRQLWKWRRLLQSS